MLVFSVVFLLGVVAPDEGAVGAEAEGPMGWQAPAAKARETVASAAARYQRDG